ncbi:MAG: AbrB/MazE/SpoVT family DNA-binding domain-containing protein [Deltaproteobacteria bacterium]|nr:MAG: AbrB/MazE/SpoVT family DNA-binding domain-containing protein [Deltaproteobacteria bacterium]
MEAQTAKIFLNGRSQAVRLPKDFRFEGKEVFIKKVGDKVILSPKPDSWTDFFMSGEKADPDFMKDRKDLPLQERHIFDD